MSPLATPLSLADPLCTKSHSFDTISMSRSTGLGHVRGVRVGDSPAV